MNEQYHRPSKPWYRLRNIVLLVCLLVAAFVGYQLYFAVTATPGGSVNYGKELHDLAASVNPDADVEDNAAPLVARILKLHTEARRRMGEDRPGAVVDFSLIESRFDPASPAATGNASGDQEDFDRRRDDALAALEHYRELRIFEVAGLAATKSTYVRPPHEGRLIEIVIPELGVVRDLARANAARMHLSRQGVEQGEFVEAFEQTLGLGRVLSTDPIIISHLVGMSLGDVALHELRTAVLAGSLTPETLEGVAAAIDRQAGYRSITHSLRGERLSTLDIIQWTHTDDGHGDGRRIVTAAAEFQRMAGQAPDAPPTVLSNLAHLVYPSKKQITAVTEELYSNVLKHAEMPPPQRRKAAWNPDAFTQSLPWNYDLLKLVTPAFISGIAKADLFSADLRGASIMVAIERYRAAHGRPPETLEALVPRYLTALPMDPFSGEAFRYRVLPVPDPDGRTYLLYSVGVDGRDDKANEKLSDPSSRGRAGQQPGTDLLINRSPDANGQ